MPTARTAKSAPTITARVADYRRRGQLQTDDDGSYSMATIKPGRYRTAGGRRPAHVHSTISSPSHQPLATRMHFAGDPQLAPTDPCAGCASDDPTLIVDSFV